MSLTPSRIGNTNMCSFLNTLVEGVNDLYGTVLKTATNTTLTNDDTGKIYHATHIIFEEAQLSSNKDDLIPNYLALWGVLNRSPEATPPSRK
jgi:hypothetical protein